MVIDAEVVKETGWQSVTGELTFPGVVERLLGAGVQSYFADLVRRETSYLGAARAACREPLCVAPLSPPAERFDAEAVRAAVRASQSRELDYPTFLRRIVAAGCVGYLVFLEGRHVLYLGRRGESHVERFPGAVP